MMASKKLNNKSILHKKWYNKINSAGTISHETKSISDTEDMKWIISSINK